ncbi:hypothetical protein [Streptomyces sp. NPDC008125]|uniref:hypothetical protein n=1 Tax=Streptomyces sp. NPDC008125 TaxID=3364811 RepID=UPI0036E764F7
MRKFHRARLCPAVGWAIVVVLLSAQGAQAAPPIGPPEDEPGTVIMSDEEYDAMVAEQHCRESGGALGGRGR